MSSVEGLLSQMLSAATNFKKAHGISEKQAIWEQYTRLFNELKNYDMTESQRDLAKKYEYIISKTFDAADEAFREMLKRSEDLSQ